MMEITLDDLRRAAEAGDADAQHLLGHAFREGRDGLPADLQAALDWYDRAARQGHLRACINVGLLGLRLLPARGDSPRPDLALPALEWAANRGDERSCCLLGEVLLTGEGGVERDRDRGRRLLELAAAEGSALAMNCLGGHLADGRYLEGDLGAANRWFREAARIKDPAGLFNLGTSLLEGRGIERDEALARKLFAHAARAHHPPAMHALAVMLIEGRGGPAKPQTGSRLLLEAARAGDASAQFALGEVLRQGLGGASMDPAGAVAWYRASATQGHPEAAYALALCAERGIGMLPDVAQALASYRAAARAGHAGAAHNLGVRFARGEGIARDPERARALLEFAGGRGSDAALVALAAHLAGHGELEEGCVVAQVAALRDPEGPGPALAAQLEERLGEESRKRVRERAESWQPAQPVPPL
jgi:TPR repeat protein